MDMRFNWIKDRVKQGQFQIYWGPGFQNLTDYFSKHHSPAHHKRIRNVYIHADERPINREGIRDSALRGCVNLSGKTGTQISQFPLGDNSSPWGDNAVFTLSHTVYTAGCAKSLTATYQYKISNTSNKLLANNILTNN
jgi:hypothetical protein